MFGLDLETDIVYREIALFKDQLCVKTVACPISPSVACRRGGVGMFKPPPEIPKALQKIVPNSTRLWKMLKKKIAEFMMLTHQDVRKKKAVKF